jgi:hypothetical protein
MHAAAYLADWKPRATWAAVIDRAATAIAADPGDVGAWIDVAMMLGDSAAAPLGLWVALHARALAPDDRRIGAHLALFLLDLGLGTDTPDRPGRVRPGPALDVWLDVELAPFGGDLARAARWSLALAAVRTGARPGPDPAP